MAATRNLKWVNRVVVDEVQPKTGCEFQFPETADELIFVAKLAEQAERYDEMVICMRKVVKLNGELGTEERNLLSVAYKNVIGARRSSWRVLTSIELRESEKSSTDNMPIITLMRNQLEYELSAVCEDILMLLDNYLIPGAVGGEASVFYLKMKGDYHRYCAETTQGDLQRNQALEAYKAALDVASSTLAPTHPIRLGLVLNFSVFYYECLRQHETGLALAREAYNEAVTELETLDEEAYRESNLIVQLLRDNLNLWTQETN